MQLDPQLSREEALGYWFEADTQDLRRRGCRPVPWALTFCGPNESGGGSHVANAAFMVAPEARGQGIGRAMGRTLFERKHAASVFRAMQFNFVVSTNESAISFVEAARFFKNRRHFAGCVFGTLKRIISMFT